MLNFQAAKLLHYYFKNETIFLKSFNCYDFQSVRSEKLVVGSFLTNCLLLTANF